MIAHTSLPQFHPIQEVLTFLARHPNQKMHLDVLIDETLQELLSHGKEKK